MNETHLFRRTMPRPVVTLVTFVVRRQIFLNLGRRLFF